MECLFTMESELKDTTRAFLRSLGCMKYGNGRKRYDAIWGGF